MRRIMPNHIKNILILIMLFFPTITCAASCDPKDTACKVEQAQIQSMENADIKPTPVVPVPEAAELIGTEKPTKPTIVEPLPFKIPPPSVSTQINDTKSSGLLPPPPQIKSRVPLNIFTPSTNTTEQPKEDIDKQESTTSQTTNQPPSGIQYR